MKAGAWSVIVRLSGRRVWGRRFGVAVDLPSIPGALVAPFPRACSSDMDHRQC